MKTWGLGAPLAAAICMRMVAAAACRAQELTPFYRGYDELVGSQDTIAAQSQLNPGNRLGLRSTSGANRMDVNAGLDYQGFRLFAESYGAFDLSGGGTAPRLYQGYVSYSTPDKASFLRAGKVVPGWGVGQIWNPVRTFENRRDLLFPDQAIEGVQLAEAQRFWNGGNVTVMALPPELKGQQWGYAARASSAYRTFDYSVSLFAGANGNLRPGLELSWVVSHLTLVAEGVELDHSQVLVVGPDGVARPRGKGERLNYVLGGNLTLPRNFLLAFEYFHDDEAYNRRELASFLTALPANAALYNAFGNGRDNFFLGVSRPFVWHDSSLALNSFYNPGSAVGVFQLKAESQLIWNFRLQLSLLQFTQAGSRTPVNLMSRALQARLKWSF
jgi:hypothetical protein